MNQLEGLTILVDAARQLPETKHLERALKWADKRLDVLRARKAKRKQWATMIDERTNLWAVWAQNKYPRAKVDKHRRLIRRSISSRLRTGLRA